MQPKYKRTFKINNIEIYLFIYLGVFFIILILTDQSSSFPKKRAWLPWEGNSNWFFCEPSFILCRFKSLPSNNWKYSKLYRFGHKSPLALPLREIDIDLASSEKRCISLEENVSPIEASNWQQSSTTTTTKTTTRSHSIVWLIIIIQEFGFL